MRMAMDLRSFNIYFSSYFGSYTSSVVSPSHRQVWIKCDQLKRNPSSNYRFDLTQSLSHSYTTRKLLMTMVMVCDIRHKSNDDTILSTTNNVLSLHAHTHTQLRYPTFARFPHIRLAAQKPTLNRVLFSFHCWVSMCCRCGSSFMLYLYSKGKENFFFLH